MALVRNRAGRGRGRGGGAGRRSRGDYAGRDHVIKTDRRNMRVYLQVGENTGDGRGLTGEGTSGKEEIENESKKKKKAGRCGQFGGVGVGVDILLLRLMSVMAVVTK